MMVPTATLSISGPSKTLAMAYFSQTSSSSPSPSPSSSSSTGFCCSIPFVSTPLLAPPCSISLSRSRRRSTRRQVVSMAPEEEKLTRRNPLDFPIEWERPKPGRRPDIFPQFSPMKTPLPPPMPYDPPEEDEEEEEKKEEEGEEEENPEKEEPELPDNI